MELCELLVKVVTQNIFVAGVVGIVVSYLATGLAWFNIDLTSDGKKVMIFVFCMALPFGALLLGVFAANCAELALTLDWVAAALKTAALAFAASQAAYIKFQNSGRVANFKSIRDKLV